MVGVLTCIDVVVDTGSETAPVCLACTVGWKMMGTVSDVESRMWAVGVVAVLMSLKLWLTVLVS